MGDELEEKKVIKEDKLNFSDDDNVSYDIRQIFKKYTCKYPRTFWNKLGQRNLRLIYQYWLLHQRCSIEFDWIIKRDFLYPEESEWNKYIERFTHSGIKISLDKQSFAIEDDKRQKLEKMFEEAKLLEDQ